MSPCNILFDIPVSVVVKANRLPPNNSGFADLPDLIFRHSENSH
jgi:hypothetical protein